MASHRHYIGNNANNSDCYVLRKEEKTREPTQLGELGFSSALKDLSR